MNDVLDYQGKLARLQNIAFDSRRPCSNSPQIFCDLKAGRAVDRAASGRPPVGPRGPGGTLEIDVGAYILELNGFPYYMQVVGRSMRHIVLSL